MGDSERVVELFPVVHHLQDTDKRAASSKPRGEERREKKIHHFKEGSGCLNIPWETIWLQHVMDVISFLWTNLFTQRCVLLLMCVTILALIKYHLENNSLAVLFLHSYSWSDRWLWKKRRAGLNWNNRFIHVWWNLWTKTNNLKQPRSHYKSENIFLNELYFHFDFQKVKSWSSVSVVTTLWVTDKLCVTFSLIIIKLSDI